MTDPLLEILAELRVETFRIGAKDLSTLAKRGLDIYAEGAMLDNEDSEGASSDRQQTSSS